MIDKDGYRANVGIILCNDEGKVFWARRCGQNAWQFPQGGIDESETPEQAMYRELFEETGLRPDDVTLIGSTQRWLRYNLPRRYIRRRQKPLCIGQKQIWYLLRLSQEESVNLQATDHPEFDRWRWVEYWSPIRYVIYFKRDVYRRALLELAPLIGRQRRRRRRKSSASSTQSNAAEVGTTSVPATSSGGDQPSSTESAQAEPAAKAPESNRSRRRRRRSGASSATAAKSQDVSEVRPKRRRRSARGGRGASLQSTPSESDSQGK